MKQCQLKKGLPAVLLFALLLVACKGEEKQQVKLPIPEDQLVKVLVDVHLAEVAGQSLLGPERDSLEAVYYHQIFRIHRVDSAAFFQSVDLLLDEPELAKEVYDKVLEVLAKMEAEGE